MVHKTAIKIWVGRKVMSYFLNKKGFSVLLKKKKTLIKMA